MENIKSFNLEELLEHNIIPEVKELFKNTKLDKENLREIKEISFVDLFLTDKEAFL